MFKKREINTSLDGGGRSLRPRKIFKQYSQWLLVLLVVVLCVLAFLARYYYPRDNSSWPYDQYFSFLFGSVCILIPVSVWIVWNDQRFHRFRIVIVQPYVIGLLVATASFLALLDIIIDILFYTSAIPVVAGLLIVFSAIEIPFNSKIREWFSEVVCRSALVFSTLLVCLILAEIIFRYAFLENMVPETPAGFQRLFIGHWLHPVAPEKIGNSIRIIGLSDSFGEFGEWNNYHSLLEEMTKDFRQPIEIVNFSKGGYAPIEQLRLLERFGATYRPDVVLHGFFVGNDFNAPQQLMRGYKEMDLRLFDSYRPRYFVVVQWLKRLQVIGRYKFKVWRERLKQTETGDDLITGDSKSGVPGERDEEQSEETTAQYTDVLFTKEEHWQTERTHLENCRKRRDPGKYWKETADLIDRIRQQAEQMGSRYVMVIHPARIQVETELLNNVREMDNISMDNFDLHLPQKFLLNFCQQQGMKCLDLLPAFRQEGEQNELFLANDIHYNSKGNQLAASGILNFLLREGFMGKDRSPTTLVTSGH